MIQYTEELQSGVREFMRKAGQSCPEKPEVPDAGIAELRVRLIREEADELEQAFVNEDLTEIADAVGDLLYVVIGTAIASGIEMNRIFAEIQRSNMSKFIDGHRRDDGKWIKGPSYSPAILAPIIKSLSEGELCEKPLGQLSCIRPKDHTSDCID